MHTYLPSYLSTYLPPLPLVANDGVLADAVGEPNHGLLRVSRRCHVGCVCRLTLSLVLSLLRVYYLFHYRLVSLGRLPVRSFYPIIIDHGVLADAVAEPNHGLLRVSRRCHVG